MNILILSRAPFPDGSAASAYILNVSRTIRAAGHHVVVIGCRRLEQTTFPISGELEGIEYINFDTKKHSKFLVYLFDNYWEKYALHTISHFKKTNIVFLYNGKRCDAKAIYRYCRRHKIKYGAFNSEWHLPENYSKDISRKKVKDITNLIPFNAENADVAIQISTLLTNYFKKHNVKTIMIPNLVDLRDKKWDCRREKVGGDNLKLAYAGIPDVGKDELATVIEAMALLPENLKRRTELHIWGPNQQQIETHMGDLKWLLQELSDNIFIYGRANQSEIPRLINGCHFTVLIRKPSLRSNAGFSTKMVESFAAGVPVMANLTGDIGSYLTDGVNGIVVHNESADACAEAIKKAHEWLENNPQMRKEAYYTAETKFDFHRYTDTMQTFLQSINS